MAKLIPNSVIGAVATAISQYYNSHSKINSLLMESGASGDIPLGTLENKCINWLKRCNEDPSVDALEVLGKVLQRFMEMEPNSLFPKISEGQRRINESLAKNQLAYQLNGHITLAGASLEVKTLTDYLRSGDFGSIEAEFGRAVAQLERDPHAAITAASAIIEATCKTYIETCGLEMPANQSITPVWRVVQTHLGLNPDPTLRDDEKRILQGLASIVDGVGAYRTHIGSAHGRGISPPAIDVSEARLAVNASHSLVIFVMERWHKRQTLASSA